MKRKLIKNSILEIILAVLIVIISIPVWNYYQNKMNYTLSLIEEETNLKLAVNKKDGYENIIVSNAYTDSKKYQLLLLTEKNCDQEFITINNISYQLKDFPKEKRNNNVAYILAVSDIQGSQKGYKISSNLEELKIIHHYELEELTIF